MPAELACLRRTYVAWFFTALAITRILAWIFERNNAAFVLAWAFIVLGIYVAWRLHCQALMTAVRLGLVLKTCIR